MNDARIIQATFADWRTVKGRKQLQLILEVPLEQQAHVLTMLGAPNPSDPQWCAIALLNLNATKPEEPAKSTQSKPANATQAGGRRAWSDLSPAQQAGIRCNEEAFWRYLGERGYVVIDHDDAASVVRTECQVTSRSDLNTDKDAAERWRNLDAEYRAWMAVPV